MWAKSKTGFSYVCQSYAPFVARCWQITIRRKVWTHTSCSWTTTLSRTVLVVGTSVYVNWHQLSTTCTMITTHRPLQQHSQAGSRLTTHSSATHQDATTANLLMITGPLQAARYDTLHLADSKNCWHSATAVTDSEDGDIRISQYKLHIIYSFFTHYNFATVQGRVKMQMWFLCNFKYSLSWLKQFSWCE